MEEKKLYTIPKAAEECGVNQRTLRNAVLSGAVPSVPVEGGRGRLVLIEDVRVWKDNPPAHKRGPKAGKKKPSGFRKTP